MVSSFLQFILDMIVDVSSLGFVFGPILALAVFAMSFRLIKRRFF